MSRVLARPMFKKKAPKRSSKGVGITSGLMDDVAGYAEGGEVTDDRNERERAARMMLERNRDENGDYQRFSESERPRMYRPPATMPMPPQPNPQQMQAMQMQQMAQMGMLPRFQEGGEVQTPSLWNRINNFLWNPPGMDRPPTLSEMRRDMGRSIGIPSLTNTGLSGARAMEDPNAMTPAIEQPRRPFIGWRESDEPERSSGRISDFSWGSMPDTSLRATQPPPSAEAQAASEMDREAARGRGLSSLPFTPSKEEAPKKKQDRAPPLPSSGEGKPSDLSDIKAEREAKAAAARQENIWLALMQAGLAIAGGKSSNAITNIGQGGQAGLASFMALEQQRRRDEDAAMRRDLAEREYGLQQRKLNMMAPVYQAQAMAPVIRAQIAAARTQADYEKALGNARLQAIRDVRAEVQKNPMNYTGRDGKPDQLKIQTAIAERQREYAQTRGGSMPSASGGTGGLGLDLPDEYDLGD